MRRAQINPQYCYSPHQPIPSLSLRFWPDAYAPRGGGSGAGVLAKRPCISVFKRNDVGGSRLQVGGSAALFGELHQPSNGQKSRAADGYQQP